MAIKCKMVQGARKQGGFLSPHAIMLTAVSTPAGESVELEFDGTALQVPYIEIEALMQKARKQCTTSKK